MVTMSLNRVQADLLWSHLIPEEGRVEEAAFVLADERKANGNIELVGRELMLLHGNDFAYQTSMHIELADEARSRMLRAAHQRCGVLIEFHSHLGSWPLEFSLSDRSGFNEWVPHVRWRLKGRPYGAVVVGRAGLDGLYWDESGMHRIAEVRCGGTATCSSGRTPLTWPFEVVYE